MRSASPEYTLPAPVDSIASMVASDKVSWKCHTIFPPDHQMVFLFARTRIASLTPNIVSVAGGTKVTLHVTGWRILGPCMKDTE